MEQEGATPAGVTGYQIDDLVINLGQQRVTRGASEIPLPHLSFDLLVTLAKAAPNFVTFDQLTERVWPGLVIAPETISQRVKLVRDALGDDPHAPRYIAGVRGRGYRMVAIVRPLVDQPQNPTAVADNPKLPSDRPSDSASSDPSAPPSHMKVLPGRRFERLIIVLLTVLAVGLAYVVVDRFWISRHSVVVQPVAASRDAATVTVAAFSPPPHSIAVLPFVNVSGDASQQYFSDGLTEELLSSLSRISELRVAARTSSFSFQGEHPDIATVAHKLNVGAVLEGSVRRDGARVRITAQLINGATGFQLWAQTYDRNLKSTFELQTDIASAVAQSLQVTLGADDAAQIGMGGSRNALAIEAYLRGLKLGPYPADDDLDAQIAAFSEAVEQDPQFAKAYVGKAKALTIYGDNVTSKLEAQRVFGQARATAVRAVELAPGLGETHAALAFVLERGFSDVARAEYEFEVARKLSANCTCLLGSTALFYSKIGRVDVAIADAERAVTLDPLNAHQYIHLGIVRWRAGRYRDAIDSLDRATELDPTDTTFVVLEFKGLAYLLVGDFEASLQSCIKLPLGTPRSKCLAIAHFKLNRLAEAYAEIAETQTSGRDEAAYDSAEIYAQWGNIPRALDSLEAAYRLSDSRLTYMRGDRLLDPLLREARFQAIERALKFPE
jgi:TolB-like protein/DNA-binding winged helix-turn-helix (wHTH) protein